jgi:hypothetical protein
MALARGIDDHACVQSLREEHDMDDVELKAERA